MTAYELGYCKFSKQSQISRILITICVLSSIFPFSYIIILLHNMFVVFGFSPSDLSKFVLFSVQTSTQLIEKVSSPTDTRTVSCQAAIGPPLDPCRSPLDCPACPAQENKIQFLPPSSPFCREQEEEERRLLFSFKNLLIYMIKTFNNGPLITAK